MQPPQTKRQLRRFLGMVNYYRDMWRKRSALVPSQSHGNGECNESFESIKRVVARGALLNFPDFSKEFHIYKDASDYQLGAVIMKDDGKQLAFCS